MGTEAKRVVMRRTNCSCSMPGVWRALSFVRGALVIFHSPRPCAHIAHGMDVGSFHRLRAAGTKVLLSPVPLLTSSLSDAEAIFGGEDRLRECIRFAAEKYQPQAIFIANSCVSGVIGDDTCAVAEEMEQELGLPVSAVSAHGFLDGEYYAGYLDAARVLVDRFMKPAERRAGSVVLLGDCGGVHGEYVKELCRLLGLLSLRVEGQFPSYLALSEMDVVPAAELLIVLGRRSDEKQALLVDLARHIHGRFGTPYLADVYAVGSEETKEWLRAVGRLCADCRGGRRSAGRYDWRPIFPRAARSAGGARPSPNRRGSPRPVAGGPGSAPPARSSGSSWPTRPRPGPLHRCSLRPPVMA